MGTAGRQSGLLVLALLAACCRAQPPPFLVAAPAGPVSAAPNTSNEEITDSILGNVYDTLVGLDPNLSLRPAVAESWHSPDDLTWVFRLRQGVRLHDGRILNAEQVAACLEHARSDPSSRRRTQLAEVVDIAAPDARTVVIRTRSPVEPLPFRLSAVLIWAKPERAGDPAVGTGAYRVQSFQTGGEVSLQAFPLHWRGPPAIESVRFIVVPEARERLARLRQGTVDLALDVAAEDLGTIKADPSLRTDSRAGLRVFSLVMDYARERSPYVMAARNPFRDLRVRQAVALAIDRERLVRGPLHSTAQLVEEIVSPEELGGEKQTLPPRAYDAVQARRLLAQAGYAHGFTVKLDFIAKKYRAIEAVAQAIVGDLAQVGITVEPRPGSASEVIARAESRDTSFYILAFSNGTGDASLSYQYLLHSPRDGYGLNNGGGYSNPTLDSLLALAIKARIPGESHAIYSRIGRLVYDDIPLIPLYRQDDLYAFSRRVSFTPRADRRIVLADLRVSPTR